MTMRQEVTAKIELLPDTGVQLIIALIDEMLRQTQVEIKEEKEEKQESKLDAFNAVMEFRRANPTPKHIDIDKIREEALEKKYGYFN